MMTIAVVGPTAVGKTAVSIALAQALGGVDRAEIISADAMQLYRHMDIGTAKVSDDERQGIVHHQIDVIEPSVDASVAAYQREARGDLARIHARGRDAVIVGGSGLYVSALLDKIDFPGTDPQLRAELTDRLERKGIEPLQAQLAQLDPVSAEIIDPRNERRLLRALEVNLLTGESFQPRFPRHTLHVEGARLFGLRMDRDLLDERIHRRTEVMFEQGLIEETRYVRQLGMGHTASKATGYREAGALLDGTMTEAEALAAVNLATRKLVSKQITWFSRDPRISWIDIDEHASAKSVATTITDAIGTDKLAP